ncbi:MAG: hypothetical protein AB1480_05830 [Nitrospirota bacterium]
MRRKKDEETGQEVIETQIFDNAPIIAYLGECGCECEPFPDRERVKFKVTGPISRLLRELQQNPKMPVLSYIQRLSTIRGLIFQLKKGK